jgi:hypothetical protein
MNVRAIMSGFNISRLPLASLVGIDVNCSEELAYTVEWFEFLARASTVSEQRTVDVKQIQVVGEHLYYRIWTDLGRTHFFRCAEGNKITIAVLIPFNARFAHCTTTCQRLYIWLG